MTVSSFTEAEGVFTLLKQRFLRFAPGSICDGAARSFRLAEGEDALFSHTAMSEHERFVEALWRKKKDEKSRQEWYRWAQQKWKEADKAERNAVVESLSQPVPAPSTGEQSGCLPAFLTSHDAGHAVSSTSSSAVTDIGDCGGDGAFMIN